MHIAPNVVFLLADDPHHGDDGCFGASGIGDMPRPDIDEFAEPVDSVEHRGTD